MDEDRLDPASDGAALASAAATAAMTASVAVVQRRGHRADTAVSTALQATDDPPDRPDAQPRRLREHNDARPVNNQGRRAHSAAYPVETATSDSGAKRPGAAHVARCSGAMTRG